MACVFARTQSQSVEEDRTSEHDSRQARERPSLVDAADGALGLRAGCGSPVGIQTTQLYRERCRYRERHESDQPAAAQPRQQQSRRGQHGCDCEACIAADREEADPCRPVAGCVRGVARAIRAICATPTPLTAIASQINP